MFLRGGVGAKALQRLKKADEALLVGGSVVGLSAYMNVASSAFIIVEVWL